MLKITESVIYGVIYTRFDWDTGYLIIQKSKFDKLSKKKKDLLFSLGSKSTCREGERYANSSQRSLRR